MTEFLPSQTALEPLPPLGDPSIQGVLVRESDGPVDFSLVREAGFTAVYFRATSGPTYVDCRLNANVSAALAIPPSAPCRVNRTASRSSCGTPSPFK